MIKRQCNTCYWEQVKGMHFGCYYNNKWRKWIPLNRVNIPTNCKNWTSYNTMYEVISRYP